MILQQNEQSIGIDFFSRRESRMNFEAMEFRVVSIDGDYANLKRTDIESDDLKLVARALLPPEIEEGSRLKYEMLQYELLK